METPGEAVSAGRTRRCVCCGNPLPAPSGRQKKPLKYCRDGEGRYEAQHGISCTELGPHKVMYERVFGQESVPGIDLQQLREHLDNARELFTPLGALSEAMTGTLTTIDDHLGNAVTQALARADQAAAEAAEADNLRLLADQERDAARSDQQAALTSRAAAEHDRDESLQREQAAVRSRDAARHDAAAAEAARTLYAQQAERDRGRMEEADRANAELTARLAALSEQLRRADELAETERVRADRAIAETEAARGETRGIREQLEAVHAELRSLTTERAVTLERQRRAARGRISKTRRTARS